MDEKGPAPDHNGEIVWRLKPFSDGSLAMEIIVMKIIQPAWEKA